MTPQRTVAFRPKTSIRYRLMSVIGLLTFGVIAVYVGASYYGMRNAALEVGGGRLNSLVDQFGTLFGQSMRTLVTTTRTTGETEAVRDFFRSSGTRSRAQVSTALAAFLPPRDSMSVVELWDANKTFLLGLTQPEPLAPSELDSEFVSASKAPAFGTVGKIRSLNGPTFYPIVVSIRDGDRLVGYIVRWRRYASSPDALEQVSRLLGTQATLYMANADGSLWTDLLIAVPVHSVEILNTREMLQYDRPAGDEVLAASRPVQGTPWVIVIEFPYAAVMTGVNSFVQGVVIVGWLLLLVGLIIAWFLSRGITKPLDALTVATEGMAQGDFSKPVEVARQDEIGKLAFAFNTMIERIQSSQRLIEDRDVELGKKSNELSQSEERYRHLFQSNPLPMWVFDAETLAFLAVNDAAIDRYGYSHEEFLSMTIKDIRPSEEQQRLLDDLAQHHTGLDKAGTWKHRKKDGTVIDVEITSHEVHFAGRDAKLVLANDVTERLRAEAAVTYSEERLSAIIEQSPLSIQVYSPDGTCLRANKAWEELWGSRREQLKGYNILADPQVASRGILPLLKKAFGGELVIVPPVYYDPREAGQEGKPRWTKAVVYPVKDAAGTIREVVLSHEDVTGIRSAEEALRDSEERYRIVAETASDGIITIDETSAILFANRAIHKVFGYSPEEIIGKQLTMLMPEYLRHLHKASIERYLATGKKHITWEGIELPGLHKNKKEIPLEVSFGEHIKDGKHTFIGIIRDISERKKAEARFKLAIDSLPNGMVIVDDVGKINLVNKEAERMFGYTREEIIGKGVEILIPERFRKHHVAFRADFAADPEARAMGSGRDLYGLRKDGTEFPLEIGLNPIEIDGKTHVLSSIVDITERKHAEERFRVAVESAPNGMVIVDHNANIVLVNSESERLFGYTREEIIGKPIEMLVPERFRKGHVMFRSNYTASPQTRSMGAGRDLYGLRKDGTEFPLEIGLNPIEISGKKHILGSIVDITERKRSEEALLINEKHNESLLRFSKQASQAQSFSNVLAAALKEVRFVLGYHNVWAYLFAEDGETASLITIAGGAADSVNRDFPVLQVKGDKMLEEINEAERPVIVEDARTDPRTNKDIVNALQNRTIINVPMMLADRKLGAFGTGSFGDEGVRVPTKEQVEYFSTMANRISIAFNRIQLTEQRERAYEEIKKLNEGLEERVNERTKLLELANKKLQMFVAMADSSFEFVSLANLQGEVFYLNDGGRKLVGLEPGQEPPKPIAAYCEPETWELIQHEGLPAVMKEGRWEGEGRLRNFKTGDAWDAAMRAFMVIDPATHEPLCLAAINSNITQRKRTEVEVASRSEELERLNKELESFSYSVSHDLRAPLRGIEGFSRLLLEDYAATLDDEGKRFLGNIIANTSKMGQLIDDLLAFSRLSRQELRVWTVDMMNMAQSVAADVSKLEQGHVVSLTMKSLPSIECDGSMLRQVWQNLISNAYKFTRRVNNPRVEVGSYEENGERVYYVKDNGAGFDMRYYDKLFGVFQRLHRQDEYEGTGVGLGIVQRVINRHGGRVWAEAALNQGATFYFALPLNGR